MSATRSKVGYFHRNELRERGWSMLLIRQHFPQPSWVGPTGIYYYSKLVVERIESTRAWYTASSEHSARRDAARTMRDDHHDRVEAGELLSRRALQFRGWTDLQITQHLRPKGLRTPEYVAALEHRLNIQPQRRTFERSGRE